MAKKILHILLIGLVAFLALTTIAGGIGLITGAIAMPIEYLAGSPFPDYTIPGLSLSILVGGAATLATILLIRHHPFALLTSGAAGVGIIIFEIVEVMVIGSPPGVARSLQVFYFSLGSIIILLTALMWLSDRKASTVR
jgi:hypothetical protein